MHGPDIYRAPAHVGSVDNAVLRRIVDVFKQERGVRTAPRERRLQPAQVAGTLREHDVVAGAQDERLAVLAVHQPPAP